MSDGQHRPHRPPTDGELRRDAASGQDVDRLRAALRRAAEENDPGKADELLAAWEASTREAERTDGITQARNELAHAASRNDRRRAQEARARWRSLLPGQEPQLQQPQGLGIAEALEEAARFEACPRLHTGLPSLDAALAPGLQAGARVVVAGEPGAGKSALAITLASRWALDTPVTWYAADQPAKDYVARLITTITPIAQTSIYGSGDLSSTALENARAARAHAAAEAHNAWGSRLRFYELHQVAVDTVVDLAIARGGVLIVDSLQKASKPSGNDSPRDRIDAVLAALRRATDAGITVLVTSETAREHYKGGKDAPSDLAAGKESGSIEYWADYQFVLRRDADTKTTTFTVPKARFGTHDLRELALSLEYSRQRSTMREVPASHVAQAKAEAIEARQIKLDEAKTTASDKKHDQLVAAVLSYVARRPGCSINALAGELGGRKSTIVGVVDELVATERVSRSTGAHGAHALRLVSAADRATSGPSEGQSDGSP